MKLSGYLLHLGLAAGVAGCAARGMAPQQQPASPSAAARAYHYQPPAQLDDGWRTASVEAVGLLRAPLERMTEAIRRGEEYRNIHSVLIAKDGQLVYEEYFAGEDTRRGVGRLGHVVFDRDTRHDVRSVTKSVVGTLVGIALADDTAALDRALLDFFPEHADLATADRRRITLRHALDMTAGLEWNEVIPYTDSLNDEGRLNRSADPVRFVLERTVVAEPGTRWTYSGGLTQVLADVVQRVADRPFLAFASDMLFEPLGITDVEWVADEGRKMPSAASGLRLRPRDMGKLGLLYAQGGRWEGRQVAPAAWVAGSMRPAIAPTDSLVELGPGALGRIEYARQWWQARYDLPYGAVAVTQAQGNGGQLVVVAPELGLVVVITSGRYNMFNDSQRLVLERILPWALGRGDTAYHFSQVRPVQLVTPGAVPEVALTAAERARYEGTYLLDDAAVRVWDEGGVLHMTGFGGASGTPLHLVPLGGHVFAHGRYDEGRLTRIYWPNDRIEFELVDGRAVRFLDRAATGSVYDRAERVR